MSRLAAFLAGLALVALPVAAAPIPEGQGGPLYYYPTRVGDRLTYKYPTADVVHVVTAVEKKGDVQVVSVGGFDDAGKARPHQKVEVSAKGLFRLESVFFGVGPAGQGSEKMVPDVPPVCLLKLPTTPGEKWVGRLGGTRQVEFVAGRPEAVKVPAGEFTAVPVDLAHETPPGARPLRARYWFAPGVGRVKWTTGDGGEVVLKTFSPGKE
jgi:hypothetical protein